MKFICVSILFICVLTATFSQWILIASFDINQKYIASALCENRNHPEKHCNGHCFLNKQLNNQEKQNGNAGTSKEKTCIQLFAEAFTNSNITIDPSNTGNYSFYRPGISQEYILSFFQPPQV
jgi:lipopolysaccharide export LptBFGC system permease protein LptF